MAEKKKTEAPAAMPALFASDVDLDKMKRRNLPTLVKHSSVPVGGIVSGEIIQVIDSPVTTVKGKLLWLRHKSGTEFTFPCTGVVRSALAPGLDGKEYDAALDKEIGKNFFAKRTETGGTGKQIGFDVYTNAK